MNKSCTDSWGYHLKILNIWKIIAILNPSMALHTNAVAQFFYRGVFMRAAKYSGVQYQCLLCSKMTHCMIR